MDSPPETGNEAESRLSVSKAQPGYAGIYQGSKLDALLRSHVTWWMSLVATLSLILRCLQSKPRSTHQLRDQEGRWDHSRNVVPIHRGNKKGPTIFSMGLELIVGVGLNLLKISIKSWGTEL